MKLYILVNDCGDGSYSLVYTLDQKVINHLQKRHDNDELEYPFPGVDGDGFSYKTINVPDNSDYESLGISRYSVLELGYDI